MTSTLRNQNDLRNEYDTKKMETTTKIKTLRGAVKKTNSIFTDIVQIGGREFNPISKKLNEMIFDKSLRGRWAQNILTKIQTLYFV